MLSVANVYKCEAAASVPFLGKVYDVVLNSECSLADICR